MTPTRGSGTTARWALPVAFAVVVVLTAALALLSFVPYAVRVPELQIALNTADGVIALVVAYLVYGRYRQTSRVRDLLLTSSLVVLAVANLPLAAVSQAVAMTQLRELDQWLPLFMRTTGAVLLAAAALTPRRVRVGRRAARRAVAGLVAATAWVWVCGLLAAEALPPAVPKGRLPDVAEPLVVGHPLLLALQGVGIVLFGAAAWSFARAARRERDEFLHWLAAASVLAAGARVNYLLFPSLYTDFLYTGDLLRLGFYLLLLVGAAREIHSYWAAGVVAAVARGRSDALREIDDVVGADLRAAVLAAEQLQPGTPEAQGGRFALDGLEEALAEVRREVELVAADELLDVRLRDAVAAVALRRGLELEVQVDAGPELPPQSEALLSIASEAVRGAGRHAGGSVVRVTVGADPLRLVVQDDGAPLAADDPRKPGLERMRRRAAETGGALTVTSSAGRGTTVTVDWL